MNVDIETLPILPNMRIRDLPQDFRVAFERHEAGLPNVSFRNGKFNKVIWVNLHPLDWPTRLDIPMDEGDSLVITHNWGVEGRILGGNAMKGEAG